MLYCTILFSVAIVLSTYHYGVQREVSIGIDNIDCQVILIKGVYYEKR